MTVQCLFVQEMLPHFRGAIEQYFAAVKQLGMHMLRIVALGLDLPADFFAPIFSRPLLVLRPFHYIPRRSLPEQA